MRLPFTKPITCGSSVTLHRHRLVQRVGFAKQSGGHQRQHRLRALPEALQGLAENTLARDSAAATVSLIGGLLLVKLFDFLSYSGVLDQVRWPCNRFCWGYLDVNVLTQEPSGVIAESQPQASAHSSRTGLDALLASLQVSTKLMQLNGLQSTTTRAAIVQKLCGQYLMYELIDEVNCQKFVFK